ncbi:MAG: FeoB-associated Cys-rich membrane protein [Lachnospiraceae bacterium]
MGTIIVLLVLVLIVFLAARSIYRDKKSGKGSCGGNCSACHGGCSCSVPEDPKKH